MGTSKGYLPPKGYLWKSAKASVTGMAKHNFDNESIGNALNKFTDARRGETSKGSFSNSKMAIAGAKAIGFINLVNSIGLTETLKNIGLESLVGKSNEEIYIGIVDYFSTESESIEDNIVRDCLSELLDEVNIFDTDNKITDNEVLQIFITKYIQKSFITNFFEKIQGLCGSIKKTNHALKEIKKYISVMLDRKYEFEDLSKISWTSKSGRDFVSKACDDAFAMFKLMEG